VDRFGAVLCPLPLVPAAAPSIDSRTQMAERFMKVSIESGLHLCLLNSNLVLNQLISYGWR